MVDDGGTKGVLILVDTSETVIRMQLVLTRIRVGEPSILCFIMEAKSKGCLWGWVRPCEIVLGG